jgi:spermidine synthase
MLKKVLSYLFPQIVFSKSSKISNELSVILVDGQLQLNTENANYSFGSLQRILEKALTRIGKTEIEKMKSILVLGVAGGSVIQSLQNKFGFVGQLIGVEIDQNVIDLANDYFGLSDYKNVTIIQADAQLYIKQNTAFFDLIIVDIFIDTQMPSFLFEADFIKNTQNALQKNGYLVFNSMVKTEQDKNRNNSYTAYFAPKNFHVTRLPLLERFNEVFLVKKITND